MESILNECITLASWKPLLQARHYSTDKEAEQTWCAVLYANDFLSLDKIGHWDLAEAVLAVDRLGTQKRCRKACKRLAERVKQLVREVADNDSRWYIFIRSEILTCALKAHFLLLRQSKSALLAALLVLQEYNDRERAIQDSWLQLILNRRQQAALQQL